MSAPGAPSVGVKHDTDDDVNEDNVGRQSLCSKEPNVLLPEMQVISGHWPGSNVIAVAGLSTSIIVVVGYSLVPL